MTQQPQHPGTIEITTAFSNEVEKVPYMSVPRQQRFVMIDAKGVETSDSNEAQEIVPIVKVRVLSLDSSGHLVAPEKARTLRILEYGRNDRLLRSTTMAR